LKAEPEGKMPLKYVVYVEYEGNIMRRYCWNNVVQKRDHCFLLVHIVISVLIVYNAEKFLTTWTKVIFSGKIRSGELFHVKYITSIAQEIHKFT
jgi:hypothetical protein